MEKEQAFLIWLNEDEAELLINTIHHTERLEHQIKNTLCCENRDELSNYIHSIKTIIEKIDFEIFIPKQYHEIEMAIFKRNILIRSMLEYKQAHKIKKQISINEIIDWYILKIKGKI